MSYQFFHAETYSEQPKPVKGAPHQFNSAAQVEAEAERDPYYSEHVDMPRPPQQLSGTLTIANFRAKRAKMLAEVRETVTSKTGTTYTRALRKDVDTLYTEIHSHPLTSAECSNDTTGEHSKVINAWWGKVRADFKKRTRPQKVAVPTTAAGNRQNPSDLHASIMHREYHLRDVDALDAEMKHQMG